MLNVKFKDIHVLLEEQSNLMLDNRLAELEEDCEMKWGNDTLLSLVEENITESSDISGFKTDFNLISESIDCFIINDDDIDTFL